MKDTFSVSGLFLFPILYPMYKNALSKILVQKLLNASLNKRWDTCLQYIQIKCRIADMVRIAGNDWIVEH